MATKNVTIPNSYKGLKAVYITPSEEGLLRKTSHPKGSPQPKKGPGGLLMMRSEGVEEEARLAAVSKAEGKKRDKRKAAAKKAKAPKRAPKKAAPKSSGKEKVRADNRAAAVAAGGTAAGTLPGPRSASSFARTRGGYDPDTSIDYTNTNPGYWSSVKNFFDNHSSNVMGETGIWIPNLEKEGAGATALAASAGGVRAIKGSNYARALPGEVPGAERALQMESIFRGGEDKTTGYGGEALGRLGKIAPKFHGSSLLGGEVVSGPGESYVSRGGDFGGLLGRGTAINTSMLDGLLGARDGDGMRLGGTYPTVRGAATSDPAAGGGMGGGMLGGVSGGGGISGGGPVVPTYMSDWSKFMPKDFSLGEAMYDTGGKEVAPGGFLYQPHAADYLGGMSSPGGMLGGGGGGMLGGAPSGPFTGTGGTSPAVTYTGTPGGFDMGSITPAVVGGSVGTRDGMTAGMHSSHLGAYERGDGTWVWGDRPSAYGDASPIGGGGLAPDRGSYMAGVKADPSAYGYGYVGAPGAGWPATGALALAMSTAESRRLGAAAAGEGADPFGADAGGMLGAGGEPDGSGYGY